MYTYKYEINEMCVIKHSYTEIFIAALYNSGIKIKTHNSESLGKEETACATTAVSYLHGWQL